LSALSKVLKTAAERMDQGLQSPNITLCADALFLRLWLENMKMN